MRKGRQMKPETFEAITYGSVKFEPGFKMKKPMRLETLATIAEIDGRFVPVGLYLREKMAAFAGKNVIMTIEVVGE
jgi:hypothetical protein